MESVYSVPVPKQPSPQLTRDDRLRIQTLFFTANHTRAQICLETGFTYNQVCYAIAHRLTPQKRKTKGRILLTTPQRKKLIQWATASRANRETPWPQIPQILSLNCGEYAIRSAFKKEGFMRGTSLKKCPLTEEGRLERLAWAIEHYDWTDEQWDKILWSDETWTQPGKHCKTWITRKIGREELYYKDTVQPRYQRKIGWMFWGSISGKYGRHKGLFWEKDWETINEGSYSGIVVPLVDEILRQYPELLFQQDNAKGHASKFTKSVFEAIGIQIMKWPANSPDLNPIETLWNDMKDYIQDHYPDCHRSYKKLKAAVLEAWESITIERIRELVHSMRGRCLAVIKARGWYTQF